MELESNPKKRLILQLEIVFFVLSKWILIIPERQRLKKVVIKNSEPEGKAA